jgi:hypothetical protein
MAMLGDRCWYLPRWLTWLPGGRRSREHANTAAAQQ